MEQFILRCWRAVLMRINKCKLIPHSVMDKLFESYQNAIIHYLERNFMDLIQGYTKLKQPNDFLVENKTHIWIMWWQGFENAPDLIKACVRQAQRFAGQENVTLLDKHNYRNYVTIESWFIQKVEEGIIPLVKLSDVMRAALIYQHGGLWLDATLYVTRDISHILDSRRLYMAHNQKKINITAVTRGRWSSFLIGGHEGDILFKFILDFHYAYYKKYNRAVDYLLIDFILEIARKYNIADFAKALDDMPAQQDDIYLLSRLMNQPIDGSKTMKLNASRTFIFKTSWKKNLVEFANGQPTYWNLMKNGRI